MNFNFLKSISFFLLISLSAAVWAGQFPNIEAKTVGNDSFQFPMQALEEGPAFFAIAMSTDRKNGEVQQLLLLDWHQELLNISAMYGGIEIYHIPVIESPPRFVQGFIRRGMRKFFEPAVSEDQAVLLFVEDVQTFSSQTGIPIDTKPAVALVHTDGSLAGYIKGESSPENIEALKNFAAALSENN